MAILFKCPNTACPQTLSFDDEHAGKQGQCTACGTIFTIPIPSQVVPAKINLAVPSPIVEQSDRWKSSLIFSCLGLVLGALLGFLISPLASSAVETARLTSYPRADALEREQKVKFIIAGALLGTVGGALFGATQVGRSLSRTILKAPAKMPKLPTADTRATCDPVGRSPITAAVLLILAGLLVFTWPLLFGGSLVGDGYVDSITMGLVFWLVAFLIFLKRPTPAVAAFFVSAGMLDDWDVAQTNYPQRVAYSLILAGILVVFATIVGFRLLLGLLILLAPIISWLGAYFIFQKRRTPTVVCTIIFSAVTLSLLVNALWRVMIESWNPFLAIPALTCFVLTAIAWFCLRKPKLKTTTDP